MQNFDKIKKQLLGSDKAGRLNNIANSADGTKISRMIDAEALERAAKSGDSAALQSMLTQVLNTDEGKRLAKNISEIMGKGKK